MLHIVAPSPAPTDATSPDRAFALSRLLMHELHHRTANVFHFALMQLELLARRTAASPSSELQDITAGFRRMVDAQRRLAVPDLERSADAATEVRAACAALADAYALLRPDVRLDCIVDERVRFEVCPSGVLSLIVGELVTNAYKHAFRQRRAGQLLVSLHAEGGGACLRVADDGHGAEAPASSGRQGMDLVRGLAEAIGGRVAVNGGAAGWKVEVAFRPR